MREQRQMKLEKGTAIAVITVELDNEYIWHNMGDSYRSPKNTSMGTYGTHRGLLRVLAALKEYGVKATFFIPGMAAEDYPQEVWEIAAQGHEIALHGYTHEDFASLAAEEQREALKRESGLWRRLQESAPWDSGCRRETVRRRLSGFWKRRDFFMTIPSLTGTFHI